MATHTESDFKWVNRVITIIFFTTIAYCAHASWLAFGEIARVIIYSRLNMSTGSELSEKNNENSGTRHESFPVFHAKKKLPSVARVAWPKINIFEKVHAKVKTYFAQTKNCTNIGRNLLELNTFIQDNILIDAIYQNLYFIKDSRGYVYAFSHEYFNSSFGNDAIHRFADHVKEVRKEADKINAPILICYSILKPTSKKYIKQDHLEILSRYNKNHEKTAQLLSSDAAHLSIEQSMLKDGYDPHDYVFKTDHHWTVEAGFYAYTKIAEFYRDHNQLHVPEEYLSKDNFHHELIVKRFFGTFNRFVGLQWAGLDDITLIYPKFPTQLEFILPYSDYRRAGNFKQALFNMHALEVTNPYDSNLYTVYLGGEHPLDIIINKQAPNSKKILVIRDSFSSVVSPYLSLIFEEVHQLDPRLYPDDVLEYIQKENPNFILYLYSPNYAFEMGKNRS